jgi:HicB-like protein involved in pilus formation
MEAAGQPERTRSERAGTHSGRLLLRMPEELHAELSRASERKGVSLNAFITSTLASAVGWRNGAQGAPPTPRRTRGAAPATQPSRRRGLELLLVANLVIVGAVGILAVVLLVHTLR